MRAFNVETANPAARQNFDWGKMVNYYYQVEGEVRNNIGDVLQGVVAKAFLPNDSSPVDREHLADINADQSAFLIANGWYLHSIDDFPPPSNVTPLYVSVHIANSGLLRRPAIREHFAAHAPIGCRDEKTLKLFLGWGIPAYYSSCLTITSHSRAENDSSRSDECLLVDNVDHPIPDEVRTKLENLLGQPLVRISHDPADTTGDLISYNQNASRHLEELLERYCRARLVITTKIHCALPCLGMGANVMMIHPRPSDPRLATVREFTDIYSFDDIARMSTPPIITVHKEKLAARRTFLESLVTEAVRLNTNPVATLPTYRLVRSKARLRARAYRAAVASSVRLNVAPERVRTTFSDEDAL